RGDGEQGDDVTHNLRMVRDLPLQLRTKKPLKLMEVRGEVYMTRKELIRLNVEREKKGLEPFANPRNLTAGSLKMLDPKLSRERRLNLFCYGLGAVEGTEPKSHHELLELLGSCGFPVNPHTEFFDTIDEVLAHIESWAEKRHGLAYETDGLVIKVDNIDQRN